MVAIAEIWDRTVGEIEAEKRLNEFIAAEDPDGPADIDGYCRFYDAWQAEIGTEKRHLRATDLARQTLSNEQKGPWCDDLLRWHGHGKNDTASRWYQVCKVCCPCGSDG